MTHIKEKYRLLVPCKHNSGIIKVNFKLVPHSDNDYSINNIMANVSNVSNVSNVPNGHKNEYIKILHENLDDEIIDKNVINIINDYLEPYCEVVCINYNYDDKIVCQEMGNKLSSLDNFRTYLYYYEVFLQIIIKIESYDKKMLAIDLTYSLKNKQKHHKTFHILYIDYFFIVR